MKLNSRFIIKPLLINKDSVEAGYTGQVLLPTLKALSLADKQYQLLVVHLSLSQHEDSFGRITSHSLLNFSVSRT